MTKYIPYDSFEITQLKCHLSIPEVNLVHTKRKIPHWLDDVVSTIEKTKKPFQFWSVKKRVELLHQELDQALNHFIWENAESKQYFIHELCQIVDLFVKLTEDKTPFISLRTIDDQYFRINKKDVSKNFHIDTSVLTLVCTYCGKGTMWLENENILRDEFNKVKMPSNPTIFENQDGHTLKEMGVFEIALIKGEIRANEESKNLDFILNFINKEEIKIYNGGNGLVHSGPGYTTGDKKRFLITVSTMKIPIFLQN